MAEISPVSTQGSPGADAGTAGQSADNGEQSAEPGAQSIPGGPAPLPEGVAADGTPDAAAAKSAAAVARIKLKIGEADEEFDPADLSKLVGKRRELDAASFRKFQEAAAQRKEVETLLQRAKDDPWSLLQKAGVDPVQAAYDLLQREVAQAEMSPEQRAREERELALAKREMDVQQHEQTREQARLQQETQQFVAQLDREVPAAMDRAGLPRSPLAANYVARSLAEMYDAGMPVDYDLAAEAAREMYQTDFKAHFNSMKYEQVVKQYPEIVDLIRKGDLASARKAVAAPQNAPATKPVQRPGVQSDKTANLRDQPIFGHDEWSAMGILRAPNPK